MGTVSRTGRAAWVLALLTALAASFLYAPVLPATAEEWTSGAPTSDGWFRTDFAEDGSSLNRIRVFLNQSRGLLDFSGWESNVTGTVTQATLVLTVLTAGYGTRLLEVRPVTNPWNMTYVTWANRDNGTAWDAAGGDFGSILQSRSLGSYIAGDTVHVDVTTWAADVVSGAATDNGLFLKGDGTSEGDSYMQFHSRTSTTAAFRPYLVVEYSTGVTGPRAAPLGPGAGGLGPARHVGPSGSMGPYRINRP